jgi:hypothetical protein
MQPRMSDFKAIEAAILKNKAYDEFQLLAEYSDKQYPKTMLGTYQRGMYFEKTGDYKRAAKEYMRAYTQEPIGDLTKEYLLDRAEALKGKKEEPKVEEVPTDTPVEPVPTEEPKKDE